MDPVRASVLIIRINEYHGGAGVNTPQIVLSESKRGGDNASESKCAQEERDYGMKSWVVRSSIQIMISQLSKTCRKKVGEDVPILPFICINARV